MRQRSAVQGCIKNVCYVFMPIVEWAFGVLESGTREMFDWACTFGSHRIVDI